jgi:hypothetical protein
MAREILEIEEMIFSQHSSALFLQLIGYVKKNGPVWLQYVCLQRFGNGGDVVRSELQALPSENNGVRVDHLCDNLLRKAGGACA